MRKLFLSLIIFPLLIFTGCGHQSGQKDVVKDSISVGKTSFDSIQNTLIGTTVLAGSTLNLNAKWNHGLWLKVIQSSECMPLSETTLPTKINSIQQPHDSILVVSIRTDGRCNCSFLGEINVLDGNTIDIIATEYGTDDDGMCRCSYDLNYTIELVNRLDFPYDQLKYISVNGGGKQPLPKLRIPRKLR